MITFGAILLLVGGLVHTIPPLNNTLSGLFGGTPIFQIVVGVISVIVGVVMILRKTALS